MEVTRKYYECEHGARWSECEFSGVKLKGTNATSKDGSICNFSGCSNDHKIKLVKVDVGDKNINFNWFKRPKVENFQGVLYKDNKRVYYSQKELRTLLTI